jgi:hypothetical protein
VTIFYTNNKVWSYGVTIWEILTLGETPFEYLNIDQVINLIPFYFSFKINNFFLNR